MPKTHIGSVNCGTCCSETKRFLLLLIVAGNTDAISFVPGSDADAVAGIGRDLLARGSDFC